MFVVIQSSSTFETKTAVDLPENVQHPPILLQIWKRARISNLMPIVKWKQIPAHHLHFTTISAVSNTSNKIQFVFQFIQKFNKRTKDSLFLCILCLYFLYKKLIFKIKQYSALNHVCFYSIALEFFFFFAETNLLKHSDYFDLLHSL